MFRLKVNSVLCAILLGILLMSVNALAFDLNPSIPTTPPFMFIRWTGTSMTYWINTGVPSTWITPINSADATWDAAKGPFVFDYNGTTTTSTNNPCGTPSTYDGTNVIIAQDCSSTDWLAVTWLWYSTTNKNILDCDITFNTYYPWSTTGAAGYYDVQNIATHELGHCLFLVDLYKGAASGATMYGYAATGETKKRTLHWDDKAGIWTLYDSKYK